MIKPTVGRVVHFWEVEPTEGRQPQAAIVAHVHSDFLVNLCVINGDGTTEARQEVTLYQGDSDRPRAPYAEWMPYQIGQAAKTEEALRQVAAQPAESQA
jgi:ribulose-5-phosphate 4-epimerase/fuculose-1-phosphate aldolase